ncbi:MAG: DUF456 domain-containing protein [Anaerolineae bacterium]|nr:DUF456 domain-containing protein [Anaerolineae bacterium]
MAESVLIVVAIVLMLVVIFLSILPVIPGPALVWAIGVVFAALTGFERVTWLSVLLMTLFMALGSTADWWLPALGMKTQGGSCLAIVGSLIGGLIGTFAIPVPIIGTLVGAVLGAFVFELARLREFRAALDAGGAALVAYVVSMAAEIVFSALIFFVFVGSLALSG